MKNKKTTKTKGKKNAPKTKNAGAIKILAAESKRLEFQIEKYTRLIGEKTERIKRIGIETLNLQADWTVEKVIIANDGHLAKADKGDVKFQGEIEIRHLCGCDYKKLKDVKEIHITKSKNFAWMENDGGWNFPNGTPIILVNNMEIIKINNGIVTI